MELNCRALSIHDDQADILNAGAAADLLVKFIRIDGVCGGSLVDIMIHLGQGDPLFPYIVPLKKGIVDDPAGSDRSQHQEKEDDRKLEPYRIADLFFFMIGTLHSRSPLSLNYKD